MAFCGLNAANPSAIPVIGSIFSPTFHRHPCLLASARASTLSNNEGEADDRGSSSSIHLKGQGNGIDTIKLHQVVEKGSVANSSDVMKLFNDVQQNMLYLNKQRIAAIDDLQKVERENEILLARIRLLEAEIEASATEREVLKRESQAFKSKFVEGYGMQNRNEKRGLKGIAEPTPAFSELLLRIDSMVLTGAVNVGQASLLKSLALKQDAQAAYIVSSLRTKNDKELASGLLPLLDPNRRYGLHIAHICTELDPIAKSGALGTFVINLSRALQRRGNLVEVILPKYATINMDIVQSLRDIQVDFHSFYGGQWHKNKIWTGIVHGVAVTLIESLHPGGFFLRDHLYDYSDDFERFSYFCRAALEYIVKSGKQPDILHLHNWQTALVAPMFWDLYVGQGLGGTRILFTCNDFKNQCLQEPAKLGLCGLDPERLHRADRLQDSLHPTLVNILKGGIVYSNKVTTMSPVYALDVMTREHGHGLESILTTHKNKFMGIYNGLDVSIWDPSTDPYLPSVYSFENLSGKLTCKAHLKQQLGLLNSDDSTPLIGCLVPQVSESELELIKAALDCASMKRSQFVFMGESKIAHVQRTIEDFQSVVEAKGGRALTKYDDSMAHLILAASDILVCVLVNQPAAEMPLIAMQYGSIPITKQQEGSDQSVMDADDVSHWKEANAFIFRSATAHQLMVALRRAIDLKVNDPQRWKDLLRNGMSKDFSWEGGCVEEYMAAYASIKQL